VAHFLVGVIVWAVILLVGYGLWRIHRRETQEALARASHITCPHCHTQGTVTPHNGVETYTTTRNPLSLSVRGTTRRVVKQLHCSHCGVTWTP